MNPVTYAQELMKRQGFEKALGIAESNRNIMQNAQSTGATPVADEVEMIEQTVMSKEGKPTTRLITIVDEPRKAKRLKKGLAFWTNVTAYIQKRNPANKAA